MWVIVPVEPSLEICADTQGTKASPRVQTTARPRAKRRNVRTIAATPVVKAALPRPRLFAPPPDRECGRLARVGFLVGYRGCFHQGTERQAVSREIDLECSGTLQTTLNQSFRQRIFDILLKRAPQWACAVTAICASLLENPLARFRRECDLHLAVNQRLVDLADEQIDDADQVGVAQRIEYDHFVEPVQELGIEDFL